MTNIQTKKELNEEYKNVKYILTSSMRTKLLLALYEHSKKLEEIRKDLKKPSATILHGLKELENKNLIRKIQKHYELTSNGYILTTNMIKLIENWYSINKSKQFWNNHDLSDIPKEMLKDIYLLKNVEYETSTTSDLSNAFNKYIKLLLKSTELKIILPIYSENHFKHMIDFLNKHEQAKLELIVNEKILNSIKQNKNLERKLLENEKVIVKCIEQDLKLFLTCSDNFMSLTLFLNDGHYDDSQILIGKDKNAIKWALNLIQCFSHN
ncbi:helix-turn-helix transcriptional regulator [Methanobrevibacter gottschalkii]|uniref:helix-turn-helix transcriptional regulator n=1 Tax=Methanobrevibacter gottschalkii TaxID=190974 RepID=UPI0038D08E2C